jgi:hypothetical protein
MLIAVLATVAMIATASAQTYTCIVVNGCKVIVVLDPCGNILSTQTDCGAAGVGTFNGPQFPAVGPVNAVLTAQSVNAVVQDPTYGAVNTTLDPTRTAATTINSLSPQSRFPLSVSIQFYANATISSKPGVTYTSRTPLNFASNNVNSLNPFTGENFTLQSDVEYYNTADLTQSTAFKLSAGSNLTLGTSGGGNGPNDPSDINNPNGIH